MVRYLEMVVYICLVISICNFIAIGVALKKKRPIFKIMYFINSLGVVAISNLLVWMEGVYVDQNNLSGSTITFALNICNIIFFIVNSMMVFKCRKADWKFDRYASIGQETVYEEKIISYALSLLYGSGNDSMWKQ